MDFGAIKDKLRHLWETNGYIAVIVLCVMVLSGTALATRALSVTEEEPTAPEATEPPMRVSATNAPTLAAALTPAPTAQALTQADGPAKVAAPVLIAPVEGTYGMRFSMDALVYHKTTDKWAAHAGLDIQAEEGSAVRAVMAGQVERVSDDPVDGVCVAIRHNNGMTSCYVGLKDAPDVKEGDTVAAGQVIGRVGTMPSESGEGPHLHLELLNGGVWIDPEGYLKALMK